MSAKTIFIVAFTAVITVFLMSNTDAVNFDFLFFEKPISKLLVVGICTLIGFILGFWAGRPRVTVSTYDKNGLQDHSEGRNMNTGKKELDDEDRDYIS